VASGKFNKEIGKIFSKLEEDREKSDYDYFFNATKNRAKKDLNNAKKIC